MTWPTVFDISDRDIASAFDRGSVARGRVYAFQDHVLQLTLDEQERVARGVVSGSGRTTYSTIVSWSEGRRPGSVDVRSRCTCPVGSDCKHGVAMIVFAQQQSDDGPSRPTGVAAWKKPLQPLVDAKTEPTHTGAKPLALQLTLEKPRPSRWGGESKAWRVMLRPMVRGARDNWIKTGASWQDVDNVYGNNGQDPEHRALLRDLAEASHSQRGGYHSTLPAIDLAQFKPELWGLLDRAADIGLDLVDGRGHTDTIAVDSGAASFSLDMSRPDPAGDLEIRPLVIESDEGPVIPVDDEHIGLIGTPAHGIFVRSGRPDGSAHIRLIRLERPLRSEVSAFIASGESVVVPASDIDEFFTDFFPRLDRLTDLGSSDGTVEPPVIVPPRVGLTVTYAKGSATLQWGFVYPRGDTATRVGSRASPLDSVMRDQQSERSALDALELPDTPPLDLKAVATAPSLFAPPVLHGFDLVTLTTQVLPWLRERGQVDLEIRGTEPTFRAAEAEPVVTLSVTDPEGSNDWFDLFVEVTIDGEKIEFTELFRALAADEAHLVLPSGTFLRIDRPELAQLRTLIGEARSLQDVRGDSDTLRISRFHASLFDELAELGVIEQQSERWAQNVGGLMNVDEIPVEPLPGGLDVTLRSYQHEGYTWLSFLYDHGLGGILADDMGLGKTVQTLAMMRRAKEQSTGPETPRFLVVAPTSVVDNWAREIERFAPGLDVVTIHETHRRRGTDLVDEIAGADVVVTSYALFRIEFEAYEAQTWAGLILDEAQFVKNHQGKTYQCARKLPAPFKLAITGTPLENSLMDLWSLLSITAPGLYPDPRRFADSYVKPIERGEGAEPLATLRRRIRPLMRRRTKDEVLTELPPKQEQVLEVTLTPRHAKVYQTHLQRERQKVLGLIDDMQKNRFEIFRSLTLLRQLSLDPALVDEAYESVGSSKIDVLVDQLHEVVAEGHRALVFSQFTGFLKRVRTRLDAEGFDYSYLDGRTRNRQRAVDEFKNGTHPLFLISLKAGGVGLNLTEADYCFVLDPWWNPAVEAQAVDRAHRIGQTSTVMVYRFVAAGTIEEKVMELKARKQQLFASVMDDEGSLSGAISADDIRDMLGV